MKLNITVKPNSSREKIETLIDGSLKIWIKKKPEKGRANKAILELLSKSYSVPKSKIEIISGLKSKNKIIEIDS
ncbi:MAG: hypothetical protein UT63_C0083G0012 [Candidatus Gottesmanbacteria bacterium GW2011_GWC2_39_8]|uniref:UPF0235 protein UT63_C0083G0012 n=1 Tax=Candidatus Gottesmanbacteria bacterium GW2011_GWC2_39_8 TaxID=1618450 RepID=A0A0G0SZX1_9BACT|nr:MAG: hypothetical protein UT63_C0083G0012 [Candidatus Gottesmanbacteria bacterium GW2011_GWC2_39_8]